MPEHLDGWPLLEHGFPARDVRWTLVSGTARHVTAFTPRLASSDHAIIVEAVRSGLGVGNLPEFVGAGFVERGEMIPVLRDWTVRKVALNALFPSHKGASPALRAFVEALASAFKRSREACPPRT